MNEEPRLEQQDEGQLDGAGLMEVPSFDTGGQVDRTGIALVHEGEWIMPAPGSEAAVRPLPGDALQAQAVAYHFPVEVEVVGELSEAQRREVADHVYDELDAALRARG